MTDPLPELLPCPFCGETELRVAFSHEAGRWDIWEVECESCCVSKDGALGFAGDEARRSAIVAWNTRAALAQISPTIEDGVTEATRDAVIAAYITGATEAHRHWAQVDDEERHLLARQDDPDFTEAAHDYTDTAISAMQAALGEKD